MYNDLFQKYYKKNKLLMIGNTILTISIFPMEIILLSWLSGMIFLYIKRKDIKQFWFYVFMFFFVLMVIISLYYLSESLDSMILPSLQKNIRNDLFCLTTNESTGINNFNNGELLTKLLKIPNYIFTNYMNTITFIIPFVFTIIFFTGYMFYINWRIGFTSFIFFSIFTTCYIYSYIYLMKKSDDRFIQENKTMNEFEDLLKNSENVILNNKIEYEKNRLKKYEDSTEKSFFKELGNINLIKYIYIITLCIYMFSIIIYCSILVIKSNLPIEKLVILTTAVVLMVRSMINLIRRCTDSVMEIGPLVKDYSFSTKILKNDIHKGIKKNFFTNYDIEIRNLSYNIDDKKILDNINLYIPHKKKILITGEIGSGKSTFLKILCGYFYPTDGYLLFDGVDIKDINIQYLRDNVTMMHQNIILFKRSVLENIFYGHSYSHQEQKLKLEQLSIYDRIKHFIDKKDATFLSGGQKQIVVLLRCFYRNPKIMILDEPTANLDFTTKNIILSLIDFLKDKMTIICVSHDPSIFYLFDDILVMNKGKLANS